MLLAYETHHDWKKAISDVIPQRKIVRTKSSPDSHTTKDTLSESPGSHVTSESTTSSPLTIEQEPSVEEMIKEESQETDQLSDDSHVT